jgi:hypothetical protein
MGMGNPIDGGLDYRKKSSIHIVCFVFHCHVCLPEGIVMKIQNHHVFVIPSLYLHDIPINVIPEQLGEQSPCELCCKL